MASSIASWAAGADLRIVLDVLGGKCAYRNRGARQYLDLGCEVIRFGAYRTRCGSGPVVKQIITEPCLPTTVRSVWAHVGMAEGEHGWKLHLSATETTAFASLSAAELPSK